MTLGGFILCFYWCSSYYVVILIISCCLPFLRACLVMAQLLEDSLFCEEFIQQCPAAVEVLNLVAQECSPGKSATLNEAKILG